VFVERERVVAAALAPIHDPSASSALQSKTALALLDAVEPVERASLEVSMPLDEEGVNQLGLAELRALTQRMGIGRTNAGDTPPA
jgi:hypothetical protein